MKWTVFKSLLNLLLLSYILLLVLLSIFDHEVCGNLTPQTEIKPNPPALEGEVLITGLPKKSLFFFKCILLIDVSCYMTPPHKKKENMTFHTWCDHCEGGLSSLSSWEFIRIFWQTNQPFYSCSTLDISYVCFIFLLFICFQCSY